ncbi:MAG: alpha/beta hydrolase-fold protein [Gemmatimonadota bacterium]
MPRRFSLRTMLFWLAPSATVGAVGLPPRSATPDTTGVTVDTIGAIASRFLETQHRVRVFLPAGYASEGKRYPLILMNDGQDAEAAGLLVTLDSLANMQAIKPVIVVAIDATGDRAQEYGVAQHPNAQGLGSRAEAYDRFVTQELLPMIRRRYRVLREPAQTAVMGWSLGALSAFDIAWRHPELFGHVGAFSGSFWWRTNDSTVAARQSSRVMHRIVRDTRKVPRIRMWFEAGRQDETDDRDGNGVIDAIQDTRELIDVLVAKGFREGPDIRYVEMEGGHNPETWGKALPHFLEWAFPNQ